MYLNVIFLAAWMSLMPEDACIANLYQDMLSLSRDIKLMIHEKTENETTSRCCVDNSELVTAAESGDLGKVKYLLAHVDPNSVKIMRNNDRSYALHEAARHGHYKILQVLLAAGADPDLQQIKSTGHVWDTPLHLAAWSHNLASVKVLVAGGASLSLKKDADYPNDTAGETATRVALRHLEHAPTDGNRLEVLKHLIRNGGTVTMLVNGKTTRQITAECGWTIPNDFLV